MHKGKVGGRCKFSTDYVLRRLQVSVCVPLKDFPPPRPPPHSLPLVLQSPDLHSPWAISLQLQELVCCCGSHILN